MSRIPAAHWRCLDLAKLELPVRVWRPPALDETTGWLLRFLRAIRPEPQQKAKPAAGSCADVRNATARARRSSLQVLLVVALVL